MRAFFSLVIVLCTSAAHADIQNPCEQDSQSVDCEATEVIIQESQSDPAGSGQDQAAQSAVSPWQGTWTGSELDTFGTRMSVTARINVTNGTVSGTWNVRTQGLKHITGQVNGKEAAITILQGGSLIKATLVDQNKFEYSGMRGHGTLSRRE